MQCDLRITALFQNRSDLIIFVYFNFHVLVYSKSWQSKKKNYFVENTKKSSSLDFLCQDHKERKINNSNARPFRVTVYIIKDRL